MNLDAEKVTTFLLLLTSKWYFVFLFILHCEYIHSSISSTCNFVINWEHIFTFSNHGVFTTAWDIIYTYHHLKILVITRPCSILLFNLLIKKKTLFYHNFYIFWWLYFHVITSFLGNPMCFILCIWKHCSKKIFTRFTRWSKSLCLKNGKNPWLSH